ncbi:MAG TPA: hypothetical protein VKE74_05520, partial [Gemmataceae bacterium]|nr:hypothetical protein [Gemmataceae bacterium]
MNEQGGLERVRSGELLYTDEVGHDACGIGGVAAKDGKPSAEVLRKALTALKCMEHRGGVCGDAGDGAGLTAVIPQPFFKEEAKRLRFDNARHLRPEDTLALGVVFFLDTDPARIEQARGVIREVLGGGPLQLLGFRPVPTHDDALPKKARGVRPGAFEHVLLQVQGDVLAAERWLFLRRLELRERFKAEELRVYVPSLSARLVSYKGLLTSPQLEAFYPDLTNPAFETGLAIF